MTDGYALWNYTCSNCHRFVSPTVIETIAYYPAAGLYGEVIEGHHSHPACGQSVPVDIINGRFVETKEEA